MATKVPGEVFYDPYAVRQPARERAVRAIVRLRRMDEAERQEAEAILDLYKSALGMA